VGNGQLGVVGNAVQLATGMPPNNDSTKDIEFWKIGLSTPANASPPNWDRWRAWGIIGSGSALSAGFPDQTLIATPQIFNRTGTIDKFSTYVSVAGTIKIVLGLYGNNLDGEVFPGIKLAQSTEVTLTNVDVTLQWTAGYQVLAGQMLWLGMSWAQSPTGTLTIASTSASQYGTGLIGSVAIGGDVSSSFAKSPIQQSTMIETNAYSATMPATFPLGGSFTFAPTTTPTTDMPMFIYRFVKS